MSLFDCHGKVALVTGASSGIGQRQAQALARAGTSVILLGRRQEQLHQASEQIGQEGGKAAVLVADLSEPPPPTRCAGSERSATSTAITTPGRS